MTGKTCGDFGGVKANGKPCTRPAGWGREESTGRCKAHSDSKLQSIKKKKEEFLKYLDDNVTTLREAAEEIGKDESTIWHWRKNDKSFDEAVEEAKFEQDLKRLERVEDSMFKRIVKGEASASETIFWLKNRGRHRWNDRQQIDIGGDTGFDEEFGERIRRKLEEVRNSKREKVDEE